MSIQQANRILQQHPVSSAIMGPIVGAASNAAYQAGQQLMTDFFRSNKNKMARKQAMGKKSKRAGRQRTQSKRSSGNNTYVTKQHDTVRQYRYRRMPRYKRKRWLKKVKQNAAMDYALAGTRTAVYNGNLEQPIRETQQQGLLSVHLYGHNGDGAAVNGLNWEFGQSDIDYLIGRDTNIFTAANKLSKFRFTSAVIDITARNSSTNNLSLEVDMYIIKYNSESDQKSFYRFHNDAVTRLKSIAPGDNPITLEKRGVTPFDIPSLASMGMKVITKQKFFVPSGDTFTYQYRDPKNRPFGDGKRFDNDGFVLPYQTVTFLFVFKPVVGGNPTDAKLTIGATRTYRYGIIGQNTLAGDHYA